MEAGQLERTVQEVEALESIYGAISVASSFTRTDSGGSECCTNLWLPQHPGYCSSSATGGRLDLVDWWRLE